MGARRPHFWRPSRKSSDDGSLGPDRVAPSERRRLSAWGAQPVWPGRAFGTIRTQAGCAGRRSETVEFAIKDCALATTATGRRAQTLRELRDILRDIHPGCIYNHFWGTLLRPQFSDREFNNDFATWCYQSLHDSVIAERLAVIDPADFEDMEGLRQELIEVIDERLDETEVMLFARSDQQFYFTRSIIVVFDTYRRLQEPAELAQVLPELSVGSVFYHFVDARRREPIWVDDFRAWLMGLGSGYKPLCDSLAEVDPYFDSLFVLRDRLAEVFAAYFGPPAPVHGPGGSGKAPR
jgi:hypothetical protein